MLLWVAVDRAIRLAPRIGIDAVPPHWIEGRDAIRQDFLQHGWSERRQAYTMVYGGDELDIAVLRGPLLAAIDAHEPRIKATFDAVQQELRAHPADDLYYRYRCDDGLPGTEGAFVAGTFWMIAIHTLRGEFDAAQALLEKALARASDIGLYAEEIDPATGEFLGNFPQGFTHMAVIHETLRLYEAMEKPG
jgi:GH15 family glucan-1,4-alpha-glucosidase